MNGDTLFDLDPTSHARRTDPETSHESARRLSDKSVMIRALLRTFDAWPTGLTAEEAAAFAGYAPAAGAWKRVSDLAAFGWIEDTGRTRIATTGRPQVVRAITDEGRRVLRS